MTDQPAQNSPTEQLMAELNALRQQLRTEETDWAKWREGHKLLTALPRSEGLQELRDRIHVLEMRLARLRR